MTNLDELKQQFSSLNNMQQKTIFQAEGPVLILAGAGSGKTTVLVNCSAYIIKAGLAEPWQILAITFTNKAVGELKDRIEAVVTVIVNLCHLDHRLDSQKCRFYLTFESLFLDLKHLKTAVGSLHNPDIVRKR